MTAPASPIATQETPRAEIMARVRSWLFATQIPEDVLEALTIIMEGGSDTIDAFRDALSSAERRIEEKERKLVDADVEWLEMRERARTAEALVTTLKAEVEELKRERDEARSRATEAHRLYDAQWHSRTAAESALASLTGQVEDAAREKVVAWMIQHSIATGHGDTLDDLLGELSAYVRKMQAERAPSPTSHRLLADAVVSRDERIASLTGQVEDMRERAAKVADDAFSAVDDRPERHLAAIVAAAIRSLPVLPTTGGGVEAHLLTTTGVEAHETMNVRDKAPHRPGDKRGGDVGS